MSEHRKAPTERGLYWFRAHADCKVWSRNTNLSACIGNWTGVEVMSLRPSGSLVVAWPGDEQLVDAECLKGDWFGPLPEPPSGH